MNRGWKLRDSKEKKDSKSTGWSKKEERLKGKQESKPRELSMKRESKWKSSSVKRKWKNTGLIRKESELREKLNLRP